MYILLLTAVIQHRSMSNGKEKWKTTILRRHLIACKKGNLYNT